MKITVGQLKRLLSEAPLADIHPVTDYPIHKGVGDTNVVTRKRRAATEKYFTTEKYRANAVKTFNNIAVPMHIVPVYTEQGQGGGNQRVRGSKKGHEYDVLSTMTELPEATIKDLVEKLKQGHCVIGVYTTMTVAQAHPTPWMIIHALFDSQSDYNFDVGVSKGLSDMHNQISVLCMNDRDDLNGNMADLDIGLVKHLTMRSARENLIATPDDAAAEIMTQAVVDTRGFFYKEPKDPHLAEKLSDIKKIVSSARKRFENAISGELFLVDVDVEA